MISESGGGRQQPHLLKPFHKLIIHFPIEPDPLLVEMRGHDPRLEREHADVGPGQLVAEPVGEGFLQGLVGVVDGLARERRASRAVVEVMLRIVPSPPPQGSMAWFSTACAMNM